MDHIRKAFLANSWLGIQTLFGSGFLMFYFFLTCFNVTTKDYSKFPYKVGPEITFLKNNYTQKWRIASYKKGALGDFRMNYKTA